VTEIVEPTGIIIDRAIARCRQRVDGEIAPSRVADRALMVKSRRWASAIQSRPNSTLAWRP